MIKKYFYIVAMVMMISLASAAANLEVTAFSCTPDEATVGETFSCTAQIQNTGDASGTLTTATLYPDSSWMENTNYPKAVSSTISVGQSTEVTWTGLVGLVSGNNGFQRITLDDVTDTFVSDEDVTINIIDINVVVSSSAASKAMEQTFTATAETTAGGDVDVTLTFSVGSGGCSIGSQTNPKTISGMTDGSKQSRTWTVTQGTSGDCVYTISAGATGIGGGATATDSDTDSVTCSDCPTPSTSSGISGGGGGGGGGGVAKYNLEQLTEEKMLTLSKNDRVKFKTNEEEHSITLKEVTDTSVTLEVKSEIQTIELGFGETKSIDLNADGDNEISIKLKSINVLTKTADLVITPLEEFKEPLLSPDEDGRTEEDKNKNQDFKETPVGEIITSKPFIWTGIIIGVIIILLITLTLLGVIKWKKIKEEDKNRRVRYYENK